MKFAKAAALLAGLLIAPQVTQAGYGGVTWGQDQTTPTATPVCIMYGTTCKVQIGVANMSTGVWTPVASALPAHSVLLGEGASAIASAGPAAAGRMLLGQGAAADPAFVAMSGDATLASNGALTLATVNASPGTYGDGLHIPQVTVDGKGRDTSVTNVLATTTLAPHVATNAALVALATTNYPNGVWRDDYATGFGAPPLFFSPQTGTCVANSLVNDGGTCVDGAGGNSWRAWMASTGYDTREFGVKCDGSTNVTSGIVNAIAAAQRTAAGGFGSGTPVILPQGKCMVNTNTIQLSYGTCLLGQGKYATQLDTLDAAGPIIKMLQRESCVRRMEFLNTGAAPTAIEVAKQADNYPVWISDNFFFGAFTDAILISAGDAEDIRDNEFASAATDIRIHSSTATTDGRIFNNRMSSGRGIVLEATGQTYEGWIFDSNTIQSTGASLYIERCLECKAINNVFTFQVDGANPGALVINGGVAGGSVTKFKSIGNWYAIANTNAAPAATCTVSVAAASKIDSISDTIVGFGRQGMCLGLGGASAASQVAIIDPDFWQPGNGNATNDIVLNECRGCNISSPMFGGSTGSLNIIGAGSSWGRMDGARFQTGVPLPVISVASPSFYFGFQSVYQSPPIMLTVNSGTVTIASGATTGTIIHGLWTTPNVNAFTVMPTNPAAVGSNAYVTGCGPTTCTLQVPVPAGSDETYAWRANNSR